MSATISVVGLGELQADFDKLAKAVGNKIVRDAVMDGARVAAKATQQAAPVRTGKLKKNIKATRVKQSETPGAATAGVRVMAPKGKTVSQRKRKGKRGQETKTEYEAPFYWRFLEYGTSKMPAAPFIRPTWDANLQKIEKATADKLAEGIDKAITG
ncbi:HK97-gp10 family putative phage morphogenesis protein [Pseudomonas sp. 148P]|uniref:HK97-gp10 family putative phage morphogenesis protein n=1 Tax=Pseudomonas ulcerans TaxID=3115852 RepID=A0ABU7HQ34_9PSED|nr:MULTISPECIES: HK97-gp10 family putative phage morphogenesis protein [unclassified Pseudomonas]MEE1922680.1 HK97-gp10 family putative phage morphogenesis protein [Pseudomonas sp. 147P]MEE1933657.1 HK97-gp10 family putative phage morphogenesis protein [Pseudomonas sp. 148P]